MNRILLDQGLSPRAAMILRQHGLDAVHVSELGMEQADDLEILEKARSEGRVCITLDRDFHSHLALTRRGRPSVVLLRVQGMDAGGQAELIRLIDLQWGTALSEGASISADRNSVRIRRLPLR